MEEFKYKIEFHSPWHCGSGLSAGADVDALVIKDRDNLPYIPGKTLKGLIREAVEDYLGFLGKDMDRVLIKSFGRKDANKPEDICRGDAFFTNAEMEEGEKNAIKANNYQQYLYDVKSSTRIDENGVADDHTLRRIQVVVPCTLYGSIYNLDKEMQDIVEEAIKMIKRIGVNRNRGLGRCTFSKQ